MLTPSLCQIFVFPGIPEIIAGASLHSDCECFYLYEMWPSIAIFEVSDKQLFIFLRLILFSMILYWVFLFILFIIEEELTKSSTEVQILWLLIPI